MVMNLSHISELQIRGGIEDNSRIILNRTYTSGHTQVA